MKLAKLTLTFLTCSLALTACTNTVSKNVTAQGHVEASDLIFPDMKKAWQKEGQFPNSENLSKIKPGVVKDELYQLIGRPHFSERKGAHEWDYIFKFYQADNSVKICQYKVIFDQHYRGQEFYWLPADCAQYAESKTHTPTPTMIATANSNPTPIINERIDLEADALFAFDKWRVSDIKAGGHEKLQQLASKLLEYQHKGEIKLMITGHTDYLGSDMYNLNLSQLRAQTIRQYLASLGVPASTMIASGAGEGEPVKECSSNLARPQIIDCLQPNRRVTVDVAVYQR